MKTNTLLLAAKLFCESVSHAMMPVVVLDILARHVSISVSASLDSGDGWLLLCLLLFGIGYGLVRYAWQLSAWQWKEDRHDL